MSYLNIIETMPRIVVETEGERVTLQEVNGTFVHEDVRVELRRYEDCVKLYLTAENTPVLRVWLVWDGGVSDNARVLGDAWERGYGDLEWRGIVPQRILPWYALAADDKGVSCYGVETGANAFCSWRLDRFNIRLCADVRNGGMGVILGGRTLEAATILSHRYDRGESAFEAAQAFCRRMCVNPRLPKGVVYGSNNWYYAYGESSAEEIMTDARLIAELAEGLAERPYAVIDDGWQISHINECSGGPWNQGNYRFPDMKKLADDIRALDLKPGIWFRPLLTTECFPVEAILRRQDNNGQCVLDPSHPLVLKKVEEMTRGLVEWGYELIKHDFSTYDIFGRWGFEMGFDMTDGGWHFHDRSKTTAEVILGLYRAIRRGAGKNTLVLGCNTVSHLSAGIFEMQRTGDDTSGREWERTRKMGVNTLAFRMPQHGAFYASDADCVGVTDLVDWRLTREWLRLLTLSHTPLFLSIDPRTVTEQQKDELKSAIRKFVTVQEDAIPLNWKDTTCPDVWMTTEGVVAFNLPCVTGEC